jgi:hypothetical protein
LRLGTVLPGLGRRTLRPPYPAAFAAFVLPRPAQQGAAPRSGSGRLPKASRVSG